MADKGREVTKMAKMVYSPVDGHLTPLWIYKYILLLYISKMAK